TADPKQVAQLKEHGYRLQVAINSHAILRKATLDIFNEAKKLPKPIDTDATELRAEIASLMRGASAPVDLKDPPPRLAQMSAADFRNYCSLAFNEGQSAAARAGTGGSLCTGGRMG